MMPAVDRETESTSTGEESSSETQRCRPPGGHGNVNGNIYLAQNGTIVRTRRTPHPNNLKVGSQFKKLDKLGVTHEEPSPIVSVEGLDAENGTGTCAPPSPNADVGLNVRASCGSLSSSLNALKSSASKASLGRSSLGRNSGGEELETSVDNRTDARETLPAHGDRAVSDEEELWMGPWNNLHIPMTKL